MNLENMVLRDYIVNSHSLYVPAAKDVCQQLTSGLLNNFSEVSVTYQYCPNLRNEPYCLSGVGICGNTKVVDIGGPSFLMPFPQLDRLYSLKNIAVQIGSPEGFIVGAGAGPHHIIHQNSEMITDVDFGSSNKTKYVTCTNGKYQLLSRIGLDEFALMANLFASDGVEGKCFKINAKKRTGALSFMSSVRESLKSSFPNKAVGMGGIFRIDKGSAWIHVMPDFATQEMKCDDDLNGWLKFFNMEAPLICHGYLISSDPPGEYLNLRPQHFHCWNQKGDGGHYHYDTSPESVEYTAFFSLAEKLYRIDQPSHTLGYGAD